MVGAVVLVYFGPYPSGPPDGNGCFECGYDLTGNLSGICPECGWDIPADFFHDHPNQAATGGSRDL